MWRIFIGKNKDLNKVENSTKKLGMCKVHCRGKGKPKQLYMEFNWKIEKVGKLLLSWVWENLKQCFSPEELGVSDGF